MSKSKTSHSFFNFLHKHFHILRITYFVGLFVAVGLMFVLPILWATANDIVPNPIFLLKFQGNLSDSSGNGNNGVAQGTGNSFVNDSSRGQVLSLDGNGWVEVNTSLPAAFTKAAWVKLTSPTPGSYNIIGNYNPNINSNVFWVSNSTYNGAPSTMTMRAATFSSSNGLQHFGWDNVVFPTNTWIHVALTYDGTTYRLYKNRILVGSSTVFTKPGLVPAPTRIGTFLNSGNWVGQISDATMWSSALTTAQISAVYLGNQGLATAPSAPTKLTGVGGNNQVNLIWDDSVSNGGSPITDYKIEYRAPNGSWTIFSDGVSIAKSAVITALTNGINYDFRISAINSAGTSNPTAVITIPAGMEYLHILSTGQSLSLGVNATPALSTTQPYNNLMMTNGADQTTTPLIPLTELGTAKEFPNTESPSSGMANTIRSLDTFGRSIIVSLHGHGSTNYLGLKKGTTYYAKGMAQVSNIKDYVKNTLQGSYKPIAVTSVHGETDYLEGRANVYADALQQWQSDYQSDISSLLGKNVNLPLFVTQMNSGWTGEVAVAQVTAHKANPGKVILVGPKYQMTYGSDHIHLTNQDSKYMGELMGKVIDKVVMKGQTWNPLMPTSVTRNTNTITISYAIPVGQLALDTTHVAPRTNYGFSFTQTGGNSPTITAVQLVNNNTQVKLTLNQIPTGTNQKIRYAWGCQSTWFCGGAQTYWYTGGNIRDTDTSVSLAPGSTNLPLYDWSVAFEEPITVILPVITNFAIPTKSNSLTIPITSFTATDDAVVTGYLLTESSLSPTTLSSGWASIPPTSYTFSSAGIKTLYAWVKDSDGNISSAVSKSVRVIDAVTPNDL